MTNTLYNLKSRRSVIHRIERGLPAHIHVRPCACQSPCLLFEAASVDLINDIGYGYIVWLLSGDSDFGLWKMWIKGDSYFEFILNIFGTACFSCEIQQGMRKAKLHNPLIFASWNACLQENGWSQTVSILRGSSNLLLRIPLWFRKWALEFFELH